jgi:hypothetical protein
VKFLDNSIKRFPNEVAIKLGNYVYRLIDPRNGETFYVGKGKGNRVFDHATGLLKMEKDEDNLSIKVGRIKEILNANLNVIYVIHRHDIPDEAIYEVEGALIDAFPGLSNIQGGHGSGAKGPMNVLELMDKYALPEIIEVPNHKLVLININNLENRGDVKEIYEQVRLAWRISKNRADQADYVLAVVRGVVVGAFEAEEWLTATHKHFPLRISPEKEMPERKGFHGKKAPDDIWKLYVGDRGMRIAIDDLKHIQNPVRYWQV